MSERIARLRTHQKNIERYQSLLKTKLNDVEQQLVGNPLARGRETIRWLVEIGLKAKK
jgi:hypothetical protein